jgi:N-methylhydantoinase B
MSLNSRTSQAKLLAQLSEAEFAERYHCDRFTAAVLASKYRYIVKHMSTDLLTQAFSVILRDWYDFAATIAGPPELDYCQPAVSDSLALFFGTMADAVRNSVEEFDATRLRPGDVVIANDPYRTGTHVNDVCFIRPVFYADRVVAFVNLQAHMLDMGGTVPGGFGTGKRNVYENGLTLGPMLLYREDEPVRETWSLIFDNARSGREMLHDIKTIRGNLRLGERLAGEVVERYGLAAAHGAMAYACDVSAEAMRVAIAALPDGVYEAEDGLDCDGVANDEEYITRVKVAIRGDRAEVDLSGTSRQARTCINAGWLDTKSAVGTAFKLLLDPVAPFTSATLRNIDIRLPEGTYVSALPPDGAIFFYSDAAHTVLLAVLRALAPVLGDGAFGGDFGSESTHNASGVRPDGSRWVSMAAVGGEHGPWGASKAGDGDSYETLYDVVALDPPLESMEAEVPVVITRREYTPDTGGAGRHRGGAAVTRDVLWLTEADHYTAPVHLKRPSGFGVYGAHDGQTGAVWMWPGAGARAAGAALLPLRDRALYERAVPVAGVLDRETQLPHPDGEYHYYARVPLWRTSPNTTFRYQTNGGGGWGDPMTRDPEKVKQDVRDGYITISAAARDYGVVIEGDPDHDPEELTIDVKATAARRQDHDAISPGQPPRSGGPRCGRAPNSGAR